ncbi:MAG: hypothetical protein M3O35_03315 [Acidobacteriota bacterium]|nr:hypothetical protein [Acidobacteriota bacterium]
MRFARLVFLIAGIYGLLPLVPVYFLESQIVPPITHPEFFYGFAGIAIAWQIAFLVVARNPVRFRPIMVAAIIEKTSYGLAVVILYLLNRLAPLPTAIGAVDLLFAVLFAAAYAFTGMQVAPVRRPASVR